MRRFGVLGLNVVATLAVGAILASGATAAEYPITALPQNGRCLKSPPKEGEWQGFHCQNHSATTTGNYNWFEGAATGKNKFKAEMEGFKAGTPMELQTLNKANLIKCQVGVIEEAEYIGSKKLKEILLLVGCTRPSTHQNCTSSPNPTQETEIEISAEGSLGFVKNAGTKKPIAGWDLNPVSVNITCGKPTETTFLTEKLEGSVIGQIAKTQTPYKENSLAYHATKGKQAIEKFENEGKDVLTGKFVEGIKAPTEEPVGLVGKEIITQEEPLEIKTRCFSGAETNLC